MQSFFCYNNVKTALKFYINVKFSKQGFSIEKKNKIKNPLKFKGLAIF